MRFIIVMLSVIMLIAVLAGCGVAATHRALTPGTVHASLTPRVAQANCHALHLAYTLHNDGETRFSWSAQMNIAEGALAEGITMRPFSGALDSGQSITIAVATDDRPRFPIGGSLAMIVNLRGADASFIKAAITCI